MNESPLTGTDARPQPDAPQVPASTGRNRTFGYDLGKFQIPADFDEALPDNVLGEFHT